MPAEGIPQADDSLFARPLRLATRLVLRFPVAVIVVGVLLALFSAVLASKHLGFHTSRLDLLNPDSGYNKLWIEYIKEFGDKDDAVIVVEGPSSEQVVPVLEELSEALAREGQLFHAILHEVDLSKIRSKGLHYLSVDELAEIDRGLDRVEPILQGDWSQLNLGKTWAGINDHLTGARDVGGAAMRAAPGTNLCRLADSLFVAMSQPGTYRSPWQDVNEGLATLSQAGSEYLLTNEGRLGFVLLRISGGEDQFAQGNHAIDRLRELIAQTQSHHAETKIGLTGLPVMENDEMRGSQSDMIRASILSLVGVACLFIAGFGGLRHPLVTVATLILAMLWSLGYITLAVGHLNILSVSFGVILIGLGIDFGIHYVARYLLLRHRMADSRRALIETAGSVGPGIVTGGLTTALAFFTATLTDFTGVAELGVVAGGGILLCVVAMLLVLPAAIYLGDRNRIARTMPEPLRVDAWLAPLFRFPRGTLLVTLALTAVLACAAFRLQYDHNLLNLQRVGLESVELERKLLEETDQSVWYALSIAQSREELLERKKRFASLKDAGQLESVDRIEDIVSRLPSDSGEKRSLIVRIGARLDSLPERPPTIPVAPPELLGRELAATQAILFQIGGRSRATRWQLEQTRDLLRRMPPGECYRRLQDYQQDVAGDLLSRLHTLKSMASPEPPQLSDFPKSLVTRFVGKSNHYLLKIYGRGDIWDMETLERFVGEVQLLDPNATGQPLQTYYASRQMQRSYIHAAIYSLIAVAIVLLLDFRSVRYTLLVLSPVLLGVVQLFGLLSLLKLPLNSANMIVLPLILGIGIDDAVHVVHDFRRQKGRYRLSSSTATAVLITSLTTMVGFGSLMVASHRGLQSLGRVLTIGVCCCLLTSIVMLPALLSWLTRNRTFEDGGEEDDAPRVATNHGRRTAKTSRTDPPHDSSLESRIAVKHSIDRHQPQQRADE